MRYSRHLLFDLTTCPPDQIHKIPKTIKQQAMGTGRLVIDEDDPRVSLLLMLGIEHYRLMRG